MRPDVDLYVSIRALIRSRLPAAIAIVMAENVPDSFSPRFYNIFSRLFTDLCSLLNHCCENGVEGLRTIYGEFVVCVYHLSFNFSND